MHSYGATTPQNHPLDLLKTLNYQHEIGDPDGLGYSLQQWVVNPQTGVGTTLFGGKWMFRHAGNERHAMERVRARGIYLTPIDRSFRRD